MNTEFVYRVENKFKQGMYTGDGNNLNHCPEYQYCRYAESGGDPKHPLPDLDLMVRSAGSSWPFGFESMEALYTWLHNSKWIEYLRDNGYFISKYEAIEVLKQGKSQLVFDPIEKVGQIALSIYGPAEFI